MGTNDQAYRECLREILEAMADCGLKIPFRFRKIAQEFGII